MVKRYIPGLEHLLHQLLQILKMMENTMLISETLNQTETGANLGNYRVRQFRSIKLEINGM